MKQPIISNLNGVTQEMIDGLEMWRKGIFSGKLVSRDACPYDLYRCRFAYEPKTSTCRKLFDNLKGCPCLIYGEEATILAFTIICDVWKVYHKEAI